MIDDRSLRTASILSPFRFVGINMWHAAWVAYSDMPRLKRELDTLGASGVTVLRIVAASEGPSDAPLQVWPTLQPSPGKFDEPMAVALDRVLAELRQRGMRAILTLNNQWTWSGGFATYLTWARGEDWRSIPYPSAHMPSYWEGRPQSLRPLDPSADWHRYQVWAGSFYSTPKAIALAEGTLRFVLSRVNSLTMVAYRDDPTILAYELCNEPRAVADSAEARPAVREAYLRWVERTASLAKRLSPNHLVTVGAEGTTPFEAYANNDFVATHAIESVDLVTIHVWPQNWGWGDASSPLPFAAAVRHAVPYVEAHAKLAAGLPGARTGQGQGQGQGGGKRGKPLVLSEFGMARDLQSHDASSSVPLRRDAFYSEMVRAAKRHGVAGVMPWAWGGEGRPRRPGGFWRVGDDVIGDPPHEPQGWYSVFETDASTLALLKRSST